jgi:peptidoglycan/LPS O-acetylase OafA/YrhL
LSGFLITGILLDTRDSPKFFQRFYVRRLLRIFPLYYAVIAFLLAVAPLAHLVSPQDANLLSEYQGWYWAYLVNLLHAIHPELTIDRFTGHFWSLAVEEQFYLLWPMLVWFLGRTWLLRVTIGAIAAAFVLRVSLVSLHVRTDWVYTMLPARVDSLAMGALLAIALRDPARVPLVRRWLPRIALGSLAVIVAIVAVNRPHMFPFWSTNVQMFGFSAVGGLAFAAVGWLVLAPAEAAARRFCELPAMNRIGRYSYAMYVVHLPIMVWSNDYLLDHGVSAARLTAPLGRVVFLLATTVLSVLVAQLSWVALERPFLRLKRYFPYGPRAVTAPQPSASPQPQLPP